MKSDVRVEEGSWTDQEESTKQQPNFPNEDRVPFVKLHLNALQEYVSCLENEKYN